jgi:MFS superfamily sulfate permease-like transporter
VTQGEFRDLLARHALRLEQSEDPREVLRAADPQRDHGEVLGSHDPERHPIEVGALGPLHRLAGEGTEDGDELRRPRSDADGLALRPKSPCRAKLVDSGQYVDAVRGLARDLPATHPWSLAVGAGALALILLGERFLPNRPVALGVVALSIAVTALFDLEGRGVHVVGALPGGLPVPSLPGVRTRDVDGLLLVALACFLLAYVEGSSVARTFALRNRYRIDPDQELLALGSANLAVGLGHGYPVAGGMSQSAVNAAAGARTPLSLVAASLVIAAILLFATGLTRQLPEPLLAAVVLGAVRGLFDPVELRFLWRASRPEFRVALVALAGVLTLGVLRGVVVASILSLVTLIRRAERPPMAVLGRIAGTDRFRNLENHPEAERIRGVLVFRVEGGLVYFNVENVRAELLRRVEESADPVRLVVFEFAAVPHVDLAGARLVATLRDELKARGARLLLAEARRSVRETLRRAGVEQGIGPLDRRRSIAELVETGRPDPVR